MIQHFDEWDGVPQYFQFYIILDYQLEFDHFLKKKNVQGVL